MKLNNYVILYNDGNLSVADIKIECVSGGWIPLFILRGISDNGVTVPMFDDPKIAKQFMNRNLLNKVDSGTVNLTDEDIGKIGEYGWEIERMDFPRRFNTHPDYAIDFEIFYGDFISGKSAYRRGN